MSEIPPPAASSALIERVKAIILKPAEEWPRIEAEPATIAGIYRSYVIPLAAVPAVATALGMLIFGFSVLGITYRPGIGEVITGAVLQFALTLIGVYVLALIIDFLAPKFGATPNKLNAFKVAAYSSTAAWVAGIFNILPAIGWLSILGLYSLYLLYLGLPKLMKAPEDKALSYTAVTIVCAIIIMVVIGAVTTQLSGLVTSGPRFAGNGGSVSGDLSVHGVGKVDLGKLDEAVKQMEKATTSDGKPVQSIDPATLQAMLPETLAGLARVEVASAAAGAAGLGGSTADARYGDGDTRITLKIIDMAAMGGLAALGSAFNVQSNRQTADGYERTNTVDGRMTHEEWNNSSRSGSYNTLVGSRFMIEAEGRNIDSIDVLKSAVASIDLRALERAAG